MHNVPEAWLWGKIPQKPSMAWPATARKPLCRQIPERRTRIRLSRTPLSKGVLKMSQLGPGRQQALDTSELMAYSIDALCLHKGLSCAGGL